MGLEEANMKIPEYLLVAWNSRCRLQRVVPWFLIYSRFLYFLYLAISSVPLRYKAESVVQSPAEPHLGVKIPTNQKPPPALVSALGAKPTRDLGSATLCHNLLLVAQRGKVETTSHHNRPPLQRNIPLLPPCLPPHSTMDLFLLTSSCPQR